MGDLLVKYLEEMNLSQAKLSALLKCEPAAVSRWVRGLNPPGPMYAWKLHKLTKGKVPITHWGFMIVGGKIKKIQNSSINMGNK